MDKLSYSMGGTLWIVTLIVLFSVSKKPNSVSIEDWVVTRRSLNRFMISLALMGLIWIGIGIILAITKTWLEENIWGFMVQFLLIASPVFFFKAIFSPEEKEKK